MKSQYLSVGEVSELLTLSTKTIYKLLGAGQLPGAIKVGGTWLIDRQLLVDGLKKQALIIPDAKCQCGGLCKCKTPCGNCAKSLANGDRHELLCV